MGGGGGGGEVDTSRIDEATEFAKSVFYDYADPWTANYRQAGENALGALQFELGLGERPVLGAYDGPSASQHAANLRARKNYAAELAGAEAKIAALNMTNGVPNDGTTTMDASGHDYGADAKNLRNVLADLDRQIAAYDASPAAGTQYQGYQATPGYEWQRDQGEQALMRQAAALGGLDSGATRSALVDYGQGLANQEYGNYLARLAGMTGIGQDAVGQALSTGSNASGQALSGANSLVSAQLAQNQQASSGGSALGPILGLVGTIGGSMIGMPWLGAVGAAAGGALGGGSAFSSGGGAQRAYIG